MGPLKEIFKLLGVNEFLPSSKFIKWAAQGLCEKWNVVGEICENVIFVIAGYDKYEMNQVGAPCYGCLNGENVADAD